MSSSCRMLLWAKPIRFSSVLKDGLTLAVAEGSDVVIYSEIELDSWRPTRKLELRFQIGVMWGYQYFHVLS